MDDTLWEGNILDGYYNSNVYLWWLDRKKGCSYYGDLYDCSNSFWNIGNRFFPRPRPLIPKEDIILTADAEYAFPSGHVLIVSANAAVALALFRFTRKQRIISMLLPFEATIVCVSRIYVGAHYPLDVIGGVLLGVGIAFILIGSEKKIDTTVMMPLKRIIR